MYFTKKTEDAIVRYNNETDTEIKNKIYVDEIKYPFEKIAENIINTFKFTYIPEHYHDIKNSVVSKLFIELPRYDNTKGEAFSYFSVIAKRYLMIENNFNKKMQEKNQSLQSTMEVGSSDTELMDMEDYKQEQIRETNELIEHIIEYWENNMSLVFEKERDRSIVIAILHLFRSADSIEYFNKKAIYFLIKELTSAKPIYITKVVNTMHRHYKYIIEQYKVNGDLRGIDPLEIEEGT